MVILQLRESVVQFVPDLQFNCLAGIVDRGKVVVILVSVCFVGVLRRSFYGAVHCMSLVAAVGPLDLLSP